MPGTLFGGNSTSCWKGHDIDEDRTPWGCTEGRFGVSYFLVATHPLSLDQLEVDIPWFAPV